MLYFEYLSYLQEGFWYRSLPIGLGSGIAVYHLVKTGKLKPNKRFGAAPKVIISSFTGYWVGKLSYILSDNCKDKFLRDAPESETAYHIREERGLPQPWSAMRDFGSKENEQDEYEPKMPELSDIKIKISISSLGDNYHELMKTLHHKPFLSKKENDILADCHYHADCFYAIPLSVASGAAVFGAQKKGLISNDITTNLSGQKIAKLCQKLPRLVRNPTVHGILFGYTLGKMMYFATSDCEDRFLRNDSDGRIAKRIREIRENGSPRFLPIILMELDLSYTKKRLAILKEERGVKGLPIDDQEKRDSTNDDITEKQTDITDIDPETHGTYLADYRDISSIDWFGKTDLELPDGMKIEK